MDFLTDWKFWLFILTIIGIVFNFFAHQKLVGNDLKHLNDNVNGLKEEQGCIKQKVIDLAQDIAYLKGRQDEKSV